MEVESRTTTVVLGGSGFLGPHLVSALVFAADLDERVVSASRGVPGVSIDGDSEDYDIEQVDLLDGAAFDDFFKRLAPRKVILAAALSRVGDCADDPDLARAMNFELPGRVARWCAAHSTRLVHVSTDLVFGALPPRGERYTEKDTPAPVHAYGASKAAGEEVVLREYPHALVVRLPLLCGDSGGRGLGGSDSLVAAVRAGQRPTLFTDEWRTPLDARLAAECLVEAAASELTGLLHIAGPERLSRYELGGAVLRAHGFEDPASLVEPMTRADAGVALERCEDASLDAERARTHLRSVGRLGAGAFLDPPEVAR